MQLLLIKLLLTPLLMIAVSWSARRWGPGVGGLLAALPLSSRPISIYLWVELITRLSLNHPQPAPSFTNCST
jgi:hypothetical protein